MSLAPSLVPALALDKAEAARAAALFDRLRLPDVPGQPTLGEAAGDWFRDIVRAVHGSMQPGGLRGIADVFVLVPKKNSKTTNAAGLALVTLLLNRRPRAPLALFGPTQEIADIAFQAVLGMIEADAEIAKLLHVQDHLKRVTNRLTGATLKVTTFDPAVATGGKYVFWLLDEAHLTSKMAYAGRVVGQLRGARVAVPESVGVIITTQSDEPPAGFFREELAYARKVRDGAINNPAYLPVLYEFPESVQTDRAKPWRSPALWPQVLPNLGRSVRLDVLEREYAAAREKGDAEERRWASQHLNIEIGLALHNDRWQGADHWEAAAQAGLTLDEILARAEVCTVGIDGGGLDDLLAVAVLGRCRETGQWMLWAKAFADRGVLELRKDIAPRLLDLEQEGDLEIVDIDTGRAIKGEAQPPEAGHSGAASRESRAHLSPDVAGVVEVVAQVFDAGLLPEKNGVGLDAVGVAAIVDGLAEIGLPPGCMAAVPQGYRLTGAVLGMARKLKDGGLVHGGQKLMAFAIGNAKQEQRGNAVLITKETAGRAKIDPLLAAFNAFDLMSRNPEAAGGGMAASGLLAVA